MYKLAIFFICLFGFATNMLSASVEPTKLMVAIQRGESPAKIKNLIESGEDVNEIQSEFLRIKNPVLRYALDRGNDTESIEIIKILIKSGANVNEITYNRVEDKKVYGMMPLLSYAVIYSSPEVVQIFIDSGADVNLKLSGEGINSGKTPLTFAKELGREQIIQILKKAGAR